MEYHQKSEYNQKIYQLLDTREVSVTISSFWQGRGRRNWALNKPKKHELFVYNQKTQESRNHESKCKWIQIFL